MMYIYIEKEFEISHKKGKKKIIYLINPRMTQKQLKLLNLEICKDSHR